MEQIAQNSCIFSHDGEDINFSTWQSKMLTYKDIQNVIIKKELPKNQLVRIMAIFYLPSTTVWNIQKDIEYAKIIIFVMIISYEYEDME